MPVRPRIAEVELRYGRHAAAWTLPELDRPVVVAGPNGCGKTTLIDGLTRTLFGFDRRRSGDAAGLRARRPWRGGEVWGRVVLERGGETYEVRRDFTTGRVRILDVGRGIEDFAGDGNPGGRNQEARQYRRILTDLFGLAERDAYLRTLYVEQGALPDTGLGEHLLRVAAGGHARVDAARHEIAQAHRAVTRRPLHPEASPAINPRELETVDEEVRGLEERLAAARTARERRGPLAAAREDATERLARLESEIQRLEEAQADLGRARSAEVEARRLAELTRRLQHAGDAVALAERELSAAREAERDAASGGRYPDEFPERLAHAELRWRDLSQLGGRWAGWLGATAAALGTAASLLWLVGAPALAAAAGALAAVAAVAAAALTLDRRHRRRRLQQELDAALEGVPAASALSPATADRALARFRAQRDTAARVAVARDDLAAARREARDRLREAHEAGVPGVRTTGRRPAEAVAGAAEAARERLVRARLDLERLGAASLSLPDGVVPTEEGIREALRAAREDRKRVQDSAQTVAQELLERGTPADSVDALEAALATLTPRRAALARKAEVLEAAHALIADAYDAFRERDQERLVRHVSRHARTLTGGRIKGVEAESLLEDARVRVDGRSIELDSPPLSYGELHALLLAVRLGAADFLAGVGVLPPLVIDEPFAHLDRDRSGFLWELLVGVAGDRQVVVTTQDRLLLDDLGVRPDLSL